MRAASATRRARISSEPYCLDARGGVRARVREAWEGGVEREVCDSARGVFVSDALESGLGDGFTLKFGKSLDTTQLIAFYNLAWV